MVDWVRSLFVLRRSIKSSIVVSSATYRIASTFYTTAAKTNSLSSFNSFDANRSALPFCDTAAMTTFLSLFDAYRSAKPFCDTAVCYPREHNNRPVSCRCRYLQNTVGSSLLKG